MKKNKKNLQKEETVKISKYLDLPVQEEKKTFLQELLQSFRNIIRRIHYYGRKKLTIMFIPHSESSIININMNFYTLFLMIFFTVITVFVSTLILITRSSQNMQYYDMGVTNSQFYLQSARLAEEIVPMHRQILQFAETIARIHVNLRISRTRGEGGYGSYANFEQLENLDSLVQLCRQQKEECAPETIEQILRISLNILNLDNEVLKETGQYLEEIIQRLQSEELQNFFSHIPVGMPVKGFIGINYGTKVSVDKGNHYPLRGVEIYTLPGTPVYVMAAGKVVEVKYHPVFGLSVWVEHLPGIKSFFAHLDEVAVEQNRIVKKGDLIGYAGKTGRVTRNMLYYEVHIGTLAFNPHILMHDLQTLWLKLQKH